MWSESTFRLKGQCRQKFEPLENLTKVFKFIFIPSVFIHKKKKNRGIGRTDLKGSIEAKFFKFRYVLKLMRKHHLSWFAVTL